MYLSILLSFITILPVNDGYPHHNKQEKNFTFPHFNRGGEIL